MISRLYIDGFKSLRNLNLHTRGLNVLVGPNGSGKSSVLQTLLLLRQSADPTTGQVDELRLSGALYEAGMPIDAIHPDASHTIKIEVDKGDFNGFKGEFVLDRNDETATNNRRLGARKGGFVPRELFERTDEFAYLNAERIGPRVSYNLPSSDYTLNGKVGKFGEFTTAVLAQSFKSQVRVDGWDKVTSRRFIAATTALDSDALASDVDASQGNLFRLSNVVLGWIVPGATFSAIEY